MTDELVIQTEGLTKRFGEITSVNNLSMEVRRVCGHAIAIVLVKAIYVRPCAPC